MWRTLVLTALVMVMLGPFCLAADLNKMTDQFYTGLADIIERNMDDPDGCLREVEQYYHDHQALIVNIREETAKAMEQIAPAMSEMMEASMSMDKERLQSLEKKYQGMQPQMPQSKMSAGLTRYDNALDEFMKKHPRYGMQIGMKTLELMPALDQSVLPTTQE